MKITTTRGDVYEYNQDNGLISKNDVILSGERFEPVFVTPIDDSEAPVFVGILEKGTGSVISMSGRTNKLINSRNL